MIDNVLFSIMGLLTLTFTSCQEKQSLKGKAIITHQYTYESENTYFPHDYLMREQLGDYLKFFLEKPLEILREGNQIIIRNMHNDGFTGHQINIMLDKSLNITSVEYDEWSDNINGSETIYVVEDIILSLSKSPFDSEYITGHYTLKIRADYDPGEILSKEGVKPSTSHFTFNGKFKNYSKKEIDARLQKDSVINE